MVTERMGNVGWLAWLPSGKVSKWFLAAFWIVLLVVAGPLAGKLSSVQENDSFAWLPGEAESTQVIERLAQMQSTDEVPTLVIFHRDGGTTQADAQSVAALVAPINDLENVRDDATGPFPSEDGEALLLLVPVDAGAAGWEGIGDTVKEIQKVVDDGEPAGATSYITGPGGYAAESAEAFAGIDGQLLLVAGLVVIIILLITYRSPTLWLLPVISAGVALGISQGVVYLLAEHADLTVNGQSSSILTVLVFGAGTDYALLLVARYREELRRHEDRHEAMAFALHRAGPAIWASGGTVVAGMACLLLASMNSTRGLGPVCIVGIVVALLVMTTFLPALLVICGRRMFWPVRPSFGSDEPTETGIWNKVGRFIEVRPRKTWVITSFVLIVGSLFVVQLDATGLTNAEQYYGEPDAVKGEKLLTKHYPAGSGQPVDIVTTPDKAPEVAAVVAKIDGISKEPGAIGAPTINGDVAWITAVLEDGPDTQAARDTVERVRTAIQEVEGADAQAGGGTAILDDILNASARDNKVIIPAVLLVVFLILALLLRAIVAPLILIGTVLLSFFATLGICALVFRHVFGFAGADPALPLFVFVFLVALGIDYNIFLMTRVHEESKQHGTRKGALIGLSATGGVITSAGLVLAGTFLALGTLPLVPFAEIGMAVALGVLLDTIIVRAVLVTALNFDVAEKMWWPSQLWKDERDGLIGAQSDPEPDAQQKAELPV